MCIRDSSRGEPLATRIKSQIEKITSKNVQVGSLDITFHRDDFRERLVVPQVKGTSIEGNIDDKILILVDDVLYTGRTTRSAFDALGSFGRANSIELLVLINRRFSREIPIEPTYVGKSVDVFENEHVIVEWGLNDEESSVELFKK